MKRLDPRHLCMLLLLFLCAERASSQPATIRFSTYLGGTGLENLRDITTDAEGNVYVTGGTSSADYPTTAGAYDRTFAAGGSSLGTGGPMDVFITKLTPEGQIVWSTYLGGPNYDRAYAIEVDSLGYVYIGGRAGDGFPTTAGVLQEQFGGDASANTLYGKQDGFIAKLSPDGSQLIWATYFGVDDIGFFRDIAIDKNGNVYGAFTGSKKPNPHITPGAFRTTPPGGDDMIILKLSPDGKQALYATYLGGSGNDGGGPSIRVNEAGEAFIVGTTTSLDLPVTPGAADGTYNGGNTDLIVARLNATGSTLIYCTYFGGSGNDALETHNIAIDQDNNAYICGYTTSGDLPVTANAFQKTYGGGGDVPLAKISADGTQFLAVTYFGGAGGEGSQGIAIDANGNVVFGGGSNGLYFPTTPGALQSSGKGSGEFFIVKMAGDLSAPVYSTLIGGSAEDNGRTAWADEKGRFYVAGHSRSDDFPMVNAVQLVRSGSDDGLIVALDHEQVLPPQDSVVLSFVQTCGVAEEGTGIFEIEVARSGDITRPTVYTIEEHDNYLQLVDTLVTIPAGSSRSRFRLQLVDDGMLRYFNYTTLTLASPDTSVYFTNRYMQITLLDTVSQFSPANILGDPSFEAGTTPWQKTTNGGRSIVTAERHTGSRSMQMLLSSQFPREVYQDVSNLRLGWSSYYATGWIKSEGLAGQAFIAVQWLDANGNVVRVDTALTQTGTSDWKWFGTCTEPAGVAARFQLFASTEPDNAGTVWFDDLALREQAVMSVQDRQLSDQLFESVSVVPNPVSSQTTFRLRLQNAAHLSIEVSTMLGQRVWSATTRSQGGTTQIVFERDGLPAGTYLYRIVAREGAQQHVRSGWIQLQ